LPGILEQQIRTKVEGASSDQTVSLYRFYAVEESGSGQAWKATAFYRDYFVVRDSLEIM
jgi:hypothetical protein